VVTLRQSDFDQGTYQIQRPGLYRLGEDISFNPNSRQAGGDNGPRDDQFSDNGGPYDRRAFSLGFFAAVAVAADHVEIDLAGFKLEQSVEHALAQRFFAVIELANVPFHYAQGPANFTNTRLRGAHHVTVRDGTLGRASHHSIHGNNVSYVTITNLTMVDFEVAGVSINGGSFLTIEQCVIGPSRTDVPVNGLFSTGHFIRPYVQQVLDRCPTATIELNQVQHTGHAILDALDDVRNRTFNAVLCGVGTIPRIVDNLAAPRSGRPDGSAIYGIVLHNIGTHTNGYVMERNNSVCLDVDGEIVGMVDEHDIGVGRLRCRTFAPAANTNITIQNVQIVGLEVNVNEVEALSTQNWNKNRGTMVRTAQVDVVGAVYQYEVNVDADFGSTGNFVGNAISNAQLFVTKHLDCISDANSRGPPCQRASAPAGGVCMRHLGGDANRLQVWPNSIRQTTLDWAARGGLYPSTDGFVICGGDNMFHVNKGAVGLRVDAGDAIVVRNVEIDTVRNSGRPPTTLCPSSRTVRLHPLQSQAWYTGNDAVGISFSATVNVDLVGRNIVRNIVSSSGNAYGMQIMQVSDFIRGRVVLGSLQTLRGSQTYPQLTSTQIYTGRPDVRKDGGVPETRSLHIDRYACIPGDNMEMYAPVDSMDGMMMDDDGGRAPDPTTMTCRIVADLEAYPVAPYSISRPLPTDYASVCPAGVMMGGNMEDTSTMRVRVIRVQFTGSNVTPAQQAAFRQAALSEVVGRMSDGTSAADALQTWVTGDPVEFLVSFDIRQVTVEEAELVAQSIRLNPIVINLASASSSHTSAAATSYEAGPSGTSQADDSGSSTGGIVAGVVGALIVVMCLAVVIRLKVLMRDGRKAKALAVPVVGDGHRPAMPLPDEGTLGAEHESDAVAAGRDESEYLEVTAINPIQDLDRDEVNANADADAAPAASGHVIYDQVPDDIAHPSADGDEAGDARASNIRSAYSIVRKGTKTLAQSDTDVADSTA